MARPVLAIGGIAFVGVGLAIGLGWWWPKTAQAQETVRDRVSEVRIAQDAGNVQISERDVSQTSVTELMHYQWGRPDTAHHVDSGTLVLDGCGQGCSANYEIVVPRGTKVSGQTSSGDLLVKGAPAVDVSTESGDVEIDDVTGDVHAVAKSGNLRLNGIGGALDVQASSGDIVAEGLNGPVKAHAGSGDVTLALASQHDVTADASSGDVELTVPRGDYQVHGDSSSGDRDIAVQNDESAAYTLDVTASSGDVSVHAA